MVFKVFALFLEKRGVAGSKGFGMEQGVWQGASLWWWSFVRLVG